MSVTVYVWGAVLFVAGLAVLLITGRVAMPYEPRLVLAVVAGIVAFFGALMIGTQVWRAVR